MTLAMLVVFGAVLTAVALTRDRGGAKVVIGNPVRGETLFKGFCGSCHTLEAAGTTGRFGPNLDILRPTYAQVVRQVETGGTGGAGLPPQARLTFGPGIHEFTRADIRNMAAFVFLSTH